MVAVVGRPAMQMLIAVAVMQRGHIHHPEMIREGSDQVDRLLEAVLDLEAQAVKINDVGSGQGKIGGHQQARAPGRVNDGDEADKSSGRTETDWNARFFAARRNGGCPNGKGLRWRSWRNPCPYRWRRGPAPRAARRA